MNDGFYIWCLLFSVFISAVAQVLLKKVTQQKFSSPIQEYLNFSVIVAYSIFILATFLTILAYRSVPLSLAAILETTSYLYVTFFGVVIFKERINKKKLLSLALIIVGIAIHTILG